MFFKLKISKKVGISIAVALLLNSFSSTAETSIEKGYKIAKRSDSTDAGYGSSTVELTMTLLTAAGQSNTRELRIDSLEKVGQGNGDKSLILFDTPVDVSGTALLSHAKILDSDDQWLYLPALRRVKRISSSNKSGPFVGSEFAFEDLTASELGKYEYSYVETKEVDGMEMDVLDCKPLYERSGYSKLTCYFDTKTFQSRKIEFYDRGGRLLKTLTLTDFKLYEEKYWRPHTQTMVNHLTNKQTVIKAKEYRFNVNINKRDMEPSALERL